MTSKPFKLYIDRLKNEDTQEIFETVASDLFPLNEQELAFAQTVTVSGCAYLAKSHLILALKIRTNVRLPCSICNSEAETEIFLTDFALNVEISEIPTSIYDYKDEIRSAILLKVPQFLECNSGSCPKRKEINKYLKSEENGDYHPFSEIEGIK